jgi:hypothetical protein
MSFVTHFFIKPAKPRLIRVPSGSFSINSQGTVMSSTLPQSFPLAHIQQVAQRVLAAFRSAESAGLSVAELTFHYAKVRLVARAARGGAIVYFHPE